MEQMISTEKTRKEDGGSCNNSQMMFMAANDSKVNRIDFPRQEEKT